MSGNLYQLHDRVRKPAGSKWFVDGPYDRWGYVLKVIKQEIELPHKGLWLHLIRGTGNEGKA